MKKPFLLSTLVLATVFTVFSAYAADDPREGVSGAPPINSGYGTSVYNAGASLVSGATYVASSVMNAPSRIYS